MGLIEDLKGALSELRNYLDTTPLNEKQKTEIMRLTKSLEHLALAGGAVTATTAALENDAFLINYYRRVGRPMPKEMADLIAGKTSDEVTLAPEHAKLIHGFTLEQLTDAFVAYVPESDTKSSRESELAKHQQITGRFGDDRMG